MTMPAHLKVSRTSVRVVQCPDCRAAKGFTCNGERKDRVANHRGRVVAFVAWRDKILAKDLRNG